MSVRLAALLLLVASATAHAQEVPEDITRLLERYEHAWESGDVFELLLLAPAESEVFESLLDDEQFDDVVATAIEIRDVDVREHDGLGGALVVEFTKIQEDVQGLGTVTRGIARIELLVRTSAMMGPQILSHRVVPLPERERRLPPRGRLHVGRGPAAGRAQLPRGARPAPQGRRGRGAGAARARLARDGVPAQRGALPPRDWHRALRGPGLLLRGRLRAATR